MLIIITVILTILIAYGCHTALLVSLSSAKLYFRLGKNRTVVVEVWGILKALRADKLKCKMSCFEEI